MKSPLTLSVISVAANDVDFSPARAARSSVSSLIAVVVLAATIVVVIVVALAATIVVVVVVVATRPGIFHCNCK